MSETVTLETLAREIKIIRKQLAKPEKQTWVSASVITELTGYKGSNKLRWLREQNIVQYNANKGYLLQSLDERFIIRKQAN